MKSNETRQIGSTDKVKAPTKLMVEKKWGKGDKGEERHSSRGIAVSCKTHPARSHPRHVKYRVYEGLLQDP